jgi:cell division GTPase FtsZ
VQGISDLISDSGLINLDFADVKTVMMNRGIAHMGVGRASGEDRVTNAVKNAIESPLLETSVNGAKAILLNIMGGYDLGMLEVNEAADQIQQSADEDAIVIFGTSIKEDMKDEIIVTVIATGFEEDNKPVDFNPGADFRKIDTMKPAGVTRQTLADAISAGDIAEAAESAADAAPAAEDEPQSTPSFNNNFNIPSFLQKK